MKAPSTINSSASQRNLKKPTTEIKTAPPKRYGVASGLSKSYATGKPANASEKKPEQIKNQTTVKKESTFGARRSTITNSPAKKVLDSNS